MAFPAYGPVFDKITLVKFIRKIYLYFSIGNSQPGNQHCATAASAHTRVPCWAFCDPYIHSEKCRRYFHAVLVNTVQRGQFDIQFAASDSQQCRAPTKWLTYDK